MRELQELLEDRQGPWGVFELGFVRYEDIDKA